MKRELTLVTTTNRVDKWIDYCKHINNLFSLYGPSFEVLILDNSEEKSFKIKKELFFSVVKERNCVNFLHFDTFVECRNQQRFQVNTPFLTILDDDDRICDGFLSIFNFLKCQVVDFDYVNLSKRKFGNSEYKTDYYIKSLDSSRNKLNNFNNYDNYTEDRLSKVYPINGYCIINTDLYRNYGETIEHYVDDCFPMMNCYINCKSGIKVALPWQYYKTQNNFMFDINGLRNCDKSFAVQIGKLWEMYKDDCPELIKRQLHNVTRSLEVNKGFAPENLYNLKKSITL